MALARLGRQLVRQGSRALACSVSQQPLLAARGSATASCSGRGDAVLYGGHLQSALRAISSDGTAAEEPPQQQQQPAVQGSAGTLAKPPWTPTRLLQKRNFLPRRMGHLMQVQPENRRRAAVIKGLCIARDNRGWRTTFTIRNHAGQTGGFERSFPLYSPTVQEITILERRKVRRAKLYYLRERNPREYRV